MKFMWMFIFLVLPIVGMVYVMWHIWQILPFSNVWRWTAIGIAIATFLTMFASFTGILERVPLNVATIIYETGSSFIFILLYLVMTFLVLDALTLTRVIPREWLYSNGYTATAVTLFICALFVYGNLHYNDKFRQTLHISTTKDIAHSNTADKMRNDSTSNAKMKIVLLSDLHLGYHNRRAELARWIDLINKERPDIILIGGDIIDISVHPLLVENMAEEFHRLNAPVYACLGNHEYYSGEPLAQKFYDKAGITLLRDSVARYRGINIIGRDDRSNPHRLPLRKIMKNVDKNTFTILLDHQPYHLEQAEREGIDFQFSGHTHHGQVWPASWITDALYECSFGPLKKGDTQYYVSSGIGIWGGKFRIGTRSEYVVLTLGD